MIAVRVFATLRQGRDKVTLLSPVLEIFLTG